MDTSYFEDSRAEFERRNPELDHTMFAGGYVSSKTANTFVGWCLGIQYQIENDGDNKCH